MKKFILLSVSFIAISSHAMDRTNDQLQEEKNNATYAIDAYKGLQKEAPGLAELADLKPSYITIKSVKKAAEYYAQELGGTAIMSRLFKPIEDRTQSHEPHEVFVLQELRTQALVTNLAATLLLDYTNCILSTQQDAENLSKRIVLSHLALSVLLEKSEEKLALLQKIADHGLPEKQPDFRWKGSE